MSEENGFADIHEENEPLQFFAIFRSFIVFKGYMNMLAEKEFQEEIYSEDGLAVLNSWSWTLEFATNSQSQLIA
ncbi:Caps the barbed end of actin filaments and is able to sever them in a calcium-dependent manner [Castilleja foliolosa]|uniref:Caps the barbed end of actin filaments and is able to sever them in a calcium-dependent manner n=1 Tax=Castilleja foliolosa TaxID=1961234 RepID=A0ABD3DNB1_9LAMI